MQFNQYTMYSYAASEFKTACDDKILVDLKRLDNLTEFDEVVDFVNKVFGEVDRYKTFNYPNDIIVAISREENKIVVGAKQNGKQIFGQGWTLMSNE
jgi:hypothetical protein